MHAFGRLFANPRGAHPAPEGVCDTRAVADMTRSADDTAEAAASKPGACHAQTAQLNDDYDATGRIDAVALELNAVVRTASA